MEIYFNEFEKKRGWDHFSLCKAIRIEKGSSENNFTCFENGIGCKTIFSIGIGTFGGLVERAKQQTNMSEIHLEGNYVLKALESSPNGVLMGQTQLLFVLKRLVSLSKFYMDHEPQAFHADFNPRNISKSIFISMKLI